MANLVVSGVQWGDEGKGKMVDWLCEQADLVVRFNGGHNAGHTLVVDGKVYKLALLPSGLVRGKPGVIGNGVALDAAALLAEIERVRAQGLHVTPETLLIAETAILVLPLHSAIDARQEQNRSCKIGTTLRGIGPAYEDKAGRRAIRVCDLAEAETLSTKLDDLLAHHNPWFKGQGLPVFEKAPLLDYLLDLAPRILPFTGPAWLKLHQAGQAGQRILFEGAQAAMLDVDWGTYPFVTASNTMAAAAASGSGLGPAALGQVLGVCKAYTTRVGAGPFPTELSDAMGDRLRELGGEYGTNTGRPRRCGWFDAALVRQSAKLSGVTALALTKLDVLDTLDEIRICTAYRVAGQTQAHFPAGLAAQFQAEPQYETLEGWRVSTRGIRDWAKLPPAAQRYIQRIEMLTDTPVDLISTGPERHDTIRLKDPFMA